MVLNTLRKKSIANIVISTFGILAALTMLLLLPEHFSYAAFLGIVFYLYCIFANLKLKERFIKVTHTLVALSLTTLLVGLMIAMDKNGVSGCEGFFGARIQCFGRQDISYMIWDIIVAMIILGALTANFFRKFKNID